MSKYKIDDRVKIVGKNVCGKIAFIGKTHFSKGEWFGVILDEAKGRNNGSVDGERYFKCSRNHGIFVRDCQLEMETEQKSSEQIVNSNKAVYPNYLSSSKLKSNKGLKNAETKIEQMKQTSSKYQPRHPLSGVIEDLENSLKKKTGELNKANNQIRILEEKLKDTENKLEESVISINNSTKISVELKEQISAKEKQILALKKRQLKIEKKMEISERKRRRLEMVIEEFREITENSVIEKEIAEEKSEDFEQQLRDVKEKCKQLKLEMEVMKEEMQIQCTDSVPAIHYVNKLENQNMVLNNALLKLKDLYHSLKEQHLESKTIAEENSDEIERLKATEKFLNDSIVKYKQEADELYETIDCMLDADEIISEMATRNLNSEAKILQLDQELQEVEEQLEVNKEVEETFQEIQILCSDKIESLEFEVRNLKLALDQKSRILEFREDTIDKYRELTKVLQEKNCKISEELKAAVQEKGEAVMAAETLKLKSNQENEKNFKDVFEMEILKINYECMVEQVECWTPFMPENFFEKGSESVAIEVKLTVSKMSKKVFLLIRNLSSLIRDKLLTQNELPFLNTGSKILILLHELWCLLKVSSMSFDRGDVSCFLSLAKLHDIIAHKNLEIDGYLTYLCKGEIDRRSFLYSLKSTYNLLYEILNCQFVLEYEKTMIYSKCYAYTIRISCNCTFAHCSVLGTLDRFKSESTIKLQCVAKAANELSSTAYFVLKFIRSCEEDNMCLLPTVADKLKKYANIMKEGMDLIILIYNTSFDKSIESITYRAEQDAQTINNVVDKLEEADKELKELCNALNNGNFVNENPDHPCNESPLQKWAQLKKREREDTLNNLRTKITSCEWEIINLTKSLKMKNVKDNSFKSVSSKDVYLQTIETSDSKISLAVHHSTGNQTAIDSSMVEDLKLKLQDMESAMKYLRQKNFELNMDLIKTRQRSLPPLEMPLKPWHHPERHRIYALQKKLNKFTTKLRNIMVPLVVDISQKGNCKGKNYYRYLTQRMLVRKEIEEQIWSITIEMQKMKNTQKCVWSNTTPFHTQRIRKLGC